MTLLYILCNTNFPFLPLALILLILISLPIQIRFFNKYNYFAIMVCLLVAITTYWWLYRDIVSIEFWNDELDTIMTSQGSFNLIIQSITKQFMLAPPLDYMIMWFWIRLVHVFPLDTHEFVYRIPYMFYHTLAGILFAQILLIARSGKKNIFIVTEDIVMYILFFLLYFFNPPLFYYSIEIRYYSLLYFGSVFTVFLLISEQLTNIKYYYLILLLAFNHVFQYILFIPALLLSLNRKNKQIVIKMLFILAISGVVFLPNTLNSIFISSSKWLMFLHPIPILVVFEHINTIIRMQFTSTIQVVLVIFLLFLSGTTVLKFNTFKNVTLLIFIYLLIVIILQYIFKYGAFAPRNLLFIQPFVLYVLMFGLAQLKNKITMIISMFVLLIFIIPWIITIHETISSQDIETKPYLHGTKTLTKIVRDMHGTIVYIPDKLMESPESLETKQWYSKQYDVIMKNNWEETFACQEMLYNKNIFLIRHFHQDINCPQTISSPIVLYKTLINDATVLSQQSLTGLDSRAQ